MQMVIGSIIVIGCVLGGYVLSDGHLLALWHPNEILIIGGAALGAFIISNPMHTLKEVFHSLPRLLMGNKFNKMFYMDLLSLMYDLFDKTRKQGVLAIEGDIENPSQSEVFTRYPAVMQMKPIIEFITDYMRIISAGNLAPHELEGLMDMEIETRLAELEEPSHAVSKVADALPGFGIVAAVLGIVITMGALGGPPEEIGTKVATALVGTFLGIWAAYGFVGPISVALEHEAKAQIKAYESIKQAMLASMTGLAPQLAVEFGRKALFYENRPVFEELNDHVKNKA